MGLIAADLWTEVPRADLPHNATVIPSHFVFKIKLVEGKFDKCKARLVYDGHRSVFGRDFLETSSYMPSQKAMRMFFSLTASRDWDLAGFDISQAYTVAECPFDDSLMELCPIPHDSDNSDFKLGHGKGMLQR